MTVPASIGDAIARRLAGLGASVQRIIEQAAVLGETFDLQALIATSETDLAATLAAVDSAEGVGLIRAVPGSDGEFSFVHALTREAVIGRMAASQLRIMHARAAEALEGRADPSVVPRLADHYLLAHVLGYHEQALRYAREAARMAEHSLAYEDAAKWFERAASLPELSRADRARMNLGAACNHVRAGDFARARGIYERLSAADDPLIRLEAAVGYEDANWRPGLADPKAADLLASALESCGLNTDDPRYVHAMGSFGRALAFAGEAVRGREISSLAIDYARAANDPVVVRHALETSLWQGLTPDMCERNCSVRPNFRTWRCCVVTTRRSVRPPTFAPWSAIRLVCPTTSVERSPTCNDRPRPVGSPSSASSARAFSQGWPTCAAISPTRNGGPIRLTHRQLAWRGHDRGGHGVQMFMIRRESGYLKMFGGFVDGSETFAGRWVPGLLALYTELDCERGMTRALSHLLNRNLGDHSADAQWPMDLVFMVEAALELGDREAVHVSAPSLLTTKAKTSWLASSSRSSAVRTDTWPGSLRSR